MEFSVETLRHWMVEDGLWIPRARREPRVQQPRRRRRPCRGELIQIDGCDHEWFEERAGRCTLLVFVDDATSALMELLFCESESAFSYFVAMRSYLEQHGKPVALYSARSECSAPTSGLLYVLDPTDAARAARSKAVGIKEWEDGSLRFWHGEHELPATAFPKEHRLKQGEVVENKRLSAALDFIQAQQRERTEAKVAKPSTTRRDARLLRAGTPRRAAMGSSAETRP